MTQTLTDDIANFLTDLVRQDLAPKTIATYKVDLTAFAGWFPPRSGNPSPHRP